MSKVNLDFKYKYQYYFEGLAGTSDMRIYTTEKINKCLLRWTFVAIYISDSGLQFSLHVH